MNIQRLSLLFIALVFLLFFIPKNISAHPGRTASDGCHYCRTNCAKWGEVAGARHCHGGYTAPAPAYTAPTTKPTVKPTAKPTMTPTPTPEPQVEGVSDASSLLGALVGGAALLGGGYWGLKWLARVTAPKEDTTPPPAD